MAAGSSTLFWVPYTLRARGPLNQAAGKRRHDGILVRLDDGFGCVHPWPELGDAPLATQLEALRAGRQTPLTQRALDCARQDGIARRAGLSLFQGCTVPESHATLGETTIAAVEEARRTGFRAAKCKGGPSNLALIADLAENTSLPLRIDFNELLNVSELNLFVSRLSEKAMSRIQFLEDPVPFHVSSWKSIAEALNVNLAVDRHEQDAPPGAAAVRVLKPALADPVAAASRFPSDSARLVVTSSMDHAIGQLFAAHEAARVARIFPQRVDLCGLVTHPLFEPDPFFEQLPDGPWLRPPGGAGLGFGDLLERLPWKRLT